MKTSVYSLVLMDDVIKKIDKLAYENSTNRSNLINTLLAQYVSIVTPQDRMKVIFSSLSKEIDKLESFIIEPTTTEKTFMVKSAVQYKYNPIMKYNVELYKNNTKHFGCIKAGIRTQNENLINITSNFFEIFKEIEYRYIDFKNYEFHRIARGKMQRQFIVGMNSQIDDEILGKSISLYIDTIDIALKEYFNHLKNYEYSVEIVNRVYKDYMSKQKIII